MESVHVHVSQITAPLLPERNTQDGNRLLLVQMLPSSSGTNVEMRGTDILRTKTVWTFEYSSADKDKLSLDFVLREQVSIHKILEIGHLRIPFHWLSVNHVTRESFYMQPVGHTETILIHLEIHLNENSAEPFQAPLTLIKPRQFITPAFNDSFETLEFSRQHRQHTLSPENQLVLDVHPSVRALAFKENTPIFGIAPPISKDDLHMETESKEDLREETKEENVHPEAHIEEEEDLSKETEIKDIMEQYLHEATETRCISEEGAHIEVHIEEEENLQEETEIKDIMEQYLHEETKEENVHLEVGIENEKDLDEETEIKGIPEEYLHEETKEENAYIEVHIEEEDRQEETEIKDIMEQYLHEETKEQGANQIEAHTEEEDFETFDERPLFPMPSLERIMQAMQEMQSTEPTVQWSFFPTEEELGSFYVPPAPLPIKIVFE